jgi:phage tail-like protein
MADASAGPRRVDPYRAFRFRVRLDGRVVAGLSRVTGLSTAPGPAEYRAGNESSRIRRLAGGSQYERVTLERGLTHDPEFEEWAGRASGSPGCDPRETDVLHDLVIETVDEAGQGLMALRMFRCRVSEIRALPAGDGQAVAIESMTLDHEGWVREPAAE